jgi:uncharacterized phiE125 gp8 family phage protein
MYDRLTPLTTSTVDVLDIDQVKQHLRVDTDDDDDLIEAYIGAATDYINGVRGIGVSLLTTQYTYTDFFFRNKFLIPIYPVQSIDLIEYRDIANNWNTVSPSIYYVDLARDPACISLNYNQFWPQVVLPPGASVRITLTAGFGDTPDAIPRDLRYAMLLMIGSYYENRAAIVGIDSRDSPAELPLGVEAILSKYRIAAFA